jgi:hypothetical protein
MSDHLSPERTGRITASRLPAILGLSPYIDRAGTMREMVRQQLGAEKEFTGNVATDWGHEHEGDAITEYERLHGVLVMPSHFYVLDRLGATPDGEVSVDGLVEAKCPYFGRYSHIDERPDYEAQIRLQLHVTGKDWCEFVVWYPEGLAPPSRVYRDPDWYPTIAEQVEEFLAEFDAIVADPDKAAPYLEPLVDERTDPEWELAALAWKEYRAAEKWAKVRKDAASEQLKVLSGGKKSRGYGVQVVPGSSGGRLNKEAAEADGIDLSKYREGGKSTLSVREAGGKS